SACTPHPLQASGTRSVEEEEERASRPRAIRAVYRCTIIYRKEEIDGPELRYGRLHPALRRGQQQRLRLRRRRGGGGGEGSEGGRVAVLRRAGRGVPAAVRGMRGPLGGDGGGAPAEGGLRGAAPRRGRGSPRAGGRRRLDMEGSHVLRLRPCDCVLGPQLHGPLPLALPDTGGQGLDDAAAIGGVPVSCCQDGRNFRASLHRPAEAGDARYVFEAKTIQRMELLVLSTLKWRMQAVTPFSYLDYFLHQLSGGNAPSRQAVREATELILCISRGTSCLEFRPSEIAATVAAAVAGEEHTAHKPACCTHVDKERVLSCHEAMIRTTGATVPPPKTAGLMGSAYSPAMSAPRSPTGVLDLDAGYLSCPSNGTSTTTTTMASSPPASSGFDGSPVSSKRRKISR
uniref:Cyclin C-terminal domain-containing protein n=1 Tax=Aegilops tauschii subsp. strangulata TaxID=200361 RepID=A0A453L0P5_AEGTS